MDKQFKVQQQQGFQFVHMLNFSELSYTTQSNVALLLILS